jgi:hypothetical protein
VTQEPPSELAVDLQLAIRDWLHETKYAEDLAPKPLLGNTVLPDKNERERTRRLPLKVLANTAVVSALIAGVFGLLSIFVGAALEPKPASSPPAAVTNCAEQQRAVLELRSAYPDEDFNYSGPSAEQCHLTDLANIPRDKMQGPGSPIP